MLHKKKSKTEKKQITKAIQKLKEDMEQRHKEERKHHGVECSEEGERDEDLKDEESEGYAICFVVQLCVNLHVSTG
jgi:hypothetical protein